MAAGEATQLADQPSGQIRDRQRVRDLGEVFTADREVQAMLDLLPEDVWAFDESRQPTFLEPSCGSGNFLVAIYDRKISRIGREVKAHQRTAQWVEFHLLFALASVYGVDISEVNVAQARLRLREAAIAARHAFAPGRPTRGFLASLDYVLAANVQRADMLNDTHHITFVEYTRPSRARFQLSLQDVPLDSMLADASDQIDIAALTTPAPRVLDFRDLAGERQDDAA